LFEGSANAQNGKLVAKGRLSECVLELYSDGRRIVTHVSDEMDGACRIGGARGSLNGAQGEKAE